MENDNQKIDNKFLKVFAVVLILWGSYSLFLEFNAGIAFLNILDGIVTIGSILMVLGSVLFIMEKRFGFSLMILGFLIVLVIGTLSYRPNWQEF